MKKVILFNLVYSTNDDRHHTLYNDNDNGVGIVSYDIKDYPILEDKDINFIVNYFKVHPTQFFTEENVSLDNFDLSLVEF